MPDEMPDFRVHFAVGPSPSLSVADLQKMRSTLPDVPDRYAVHFHPQTELGFPDDFKKLREVNIHPIAGELFPMVPDQYLPFGLIVMNNLEKYPREPLVVVIKLGGNP